MIGQVDAGRETGDKRPTFCSARARRVPDRVMVEQCLDQYFAFNGLDRQAVRSNVLFDVRIKMDE
jgi:hypothetical protein